MDRLTFVGAILMLSLVSRTSLSELQRTLNVKQMHQSDLDPVAKVVLAETKTTIFGSSHVLSTTNLPPADSDGSTTRSMEAEAVLSTSTSTTDSVRSNPVSRSEGSRDLKEGSSESISAKPVDYTGTHEDENLVKTLEDGFHRQTEENSLVDARLHQDSVVTESPAPLVGIHATITGSEGSATFSHALASDSDETANTVLPRESDTTALPPATNPVSFEARERHARVLSSELPPAVSQISEDRTTSFPDRATTDSPNDVTSAFARGASKIEHEVPTTFSGTVTSPSRDIANLNAAEKSTNFGRNISENQTISVTSNRSLPGDEPIVLPIPVSATPAEELKKVQQKSAKEELEGSTQSSALVEFEIHAAEKSATKRPSVFGSEYFTETVSSSQKNNTGNSKQKPDTTISLASDKHEVYRKAATKKANETLSLKSACVGEAPVYKQVNGNNSYEIRIYPALTWLSVNVITNNRILAELEAADKLRRYFDGENEKGIRMNFTCPVLTQIKYKGLSRERINEYAVSFYLPWEGNGEIPSPEDSEILVDVDEERTVFVHLFKTHVWQMTDSFLQTEAKKLFLSLRRHGEAFLSDYFYLASYTRNPTSLNSAHFELWAYATRYHPHQESILSRYQGSIEPLSDVTRRTRSRVCKGLECPKFDVLSVHKAGIQKRRYYGARFATYYPDFCTFTKGSIWKAFMPLHLYKHGVNSHFEVIGVTRPAGIVHVREKTKDSLGKGCNQTFSVSIYLPRRLHSTPPAAGLTAPRIKITELDDVIVYVQSVGGFLLVPERIHREIGLFRQRLQEQQLCFRKNEYYLVVYDYITRFHGRLNEIWAIADRCQDSL